MNIFFLTSCKTPKSVDHRDPVRSPPFCLITIKMHYILRPLPGSWIHKIEDSASYQNTLSKPFVSSSSESDRKKQLFTLSLLAIWRLSPPICHLCSIEELRGHNSGWGAVEFARNYISKCVSLKVYFCFRD